MKNDETEKQGGVKMSVDTLPCGCSYNGNTGEIVKVGPSCLPLFRDCLRIGLYDLQLGRHRVDLHVRRIGKKRAMGTLAGVDFTCPVDAMLEYIIENRPRARN